MKRFLLTGILAACQLVSLVARADSVLAIDNPAGHGEGKGGYAEGQGVIGDDNVSVPAYLHDWHGDYHARSGKNIGLLAAHAETGVQYGGLRIGYLGRADGLVQMDREVADLYYLHQNHLDYQVGQSLGGHYELKGFSADGLHLSDSLRYRFANGLQLALGGGISYLRGQWMKVQTADGRITAIGPQDFSYAAQMHTAEGSSSGNDGYAADAGAVLSWQDGSQLSLAANDLAGKMHWRSAFMQDETANSVTVNGTARGSKSAPVWQDLAFSLHPKWMATVSRPYGQWDVEVGISGTQGYVFPQAGVTWRFANGWQLGGQYDFRFQTVGVKVSKAWFALGLQSQNWLSPGQSRAYGLSGNLFLHF